MSQLDPRLMKNNQLSPDSPNKNPYLNFAKKRASFQIQSSCTASPTNSMMNQIPGAFPFHRVSQLGLQGLHRQNTKFRRPSHTQNRLSKQQSYGTSGKLGNTLAGGGVKKKTFYDVIANFYMAKKFMSILRGLTSTRTPKWLNNYHFETINDISFFHSVYREQEYNNLMNDEKNKTESIFNDKFKLYSKMKTFFLKKKKGRELLDYYEKFVEKMEKIFHVLDPSKSLIICWETLILLCIFMHFIVIPLETSFSINFMDLSPGLSYVNTFTIMTLVADIAKKFNTAYYLKGVLVTKRKSIAWHYLKKEFWLDILSVGSLFFKEVICEELELFNPDEWWVKILYLLFFMKYREFEYIIKKFEDLIFFDKSLNNKLALFKLILKILLISHIFACLWHIIGWESSKIASTSWLIEKGLLLRPWYIRYVYSFYYICVTMNTVGYGDITPMNIYEVLFSIVLIYVACAIFAYFLNSIGIIIANIVKQEDEFKNDLNTINDFMREKEINFELRMRVRKYLEYIWHEEKIDKVENQVKIIEKLSDSLKDELLLEANGRIIRDIKMFSLNFSEDTLRQTVGIMKEMRYTPGDLIFYKDETENKAIYIIRKGEVEIFLETPKSVNPVTVLKKLKEGDVFGELAFFSDNARTACARSTDFTTVFMIRQEDFLSVIRKYNKDFEKYCEIKDNINYYNDYSDIFLKCFSCNESTHPVKFCNLLHYTALKEIIVRRHAYTSAQERKEEVRRRKKKALNALISLPKIEAGAYELQKLIFPAHESESSSENESNDGNNEEEEEAINTNYTIQEENEENTSKMDASHRLSLKGSKEDSPLIEKSQQNSKSFKKMNTSKSTRKRSIFSMKGRKTLADEESLEIKENSEEEDSNDEEINSDMVNKGLGNNEDRKEWGRRKSRKKNILVRKSLARINSRKSVNMMDMEELDNFFSNLEGASTSARLSKEKEPQKDFKKEFRSLKSDFGETPSMRSVQSPSSNSSSKMNGVIGGFLKFMRRLVELSKGSKTNNVQEVVVALNENTLDLDRIKSFDFYFSYNNIENVIAQMEMFHLIRLRRKTGKSQNKMKHLYLQNSINQNGVPTYIRGSILVTNNKNDNNLIDDFLYNKNQEMLQKRQYNAHTFIRKNFFKNAPMLEKMMKEEQFDPEKIKEFYINKYMRGKTQTYFFKGVKMMWACWKKMWKSCCKRRKRTKLIEKNKKTTLLKLNNEDIGVGSGRTISAKLKSTKNLKK